MKNVLIMTQLLTGGGAERIAADLSRGLSKYYNVILLVYQSKPSEYKWAGNRIDLNLFSNSKIGKVFCAIKRFTRIRKIKKHYKIDYSISFVPHVDAMNVLTSNRNEKTIIDIVTNTTTALENAGFLSRLFRKISLKKANKIVADSVGIADDLVDNFGIKRESIDIIYDTCDIESIIQSQVSTEQEKWFEDGKKYICSMGSMRYPKGQWHLIKAFSVLKRKHPDARLLILGDGPYREQLVNLCKLLNISEDVSMPGFVDNPHGVLKKCDLFTLSSIYEGLPYVLIEALVCNLPIISTDCMYGPREIIDENRSYDNRIEDIYAAKHGLLVPPFKNVPEDFTDFIGDDDKLLAKSMELMLYDENVINRYSRQDNSFVNTFDYKSISEEWKRVIDAI